MHSVKFYMHQRALGDQALEIEYKRREKTLEKKMGKVRSQGTRACTDQQLRMSCLHRAVHTSAAQPAGSNVWDHC